MKRISSIRTAGFLGLLCLLGLLILASHGTLETASARDNRPAAPALSVSTREIDLGVIGPGESARAQFQITNTGEGRIRWAIEEPPGWESSTGGGLTGECGATPSRVDVVLSFLNVRPEAGDHPVEIRIASGRNSLVLRRTLAEGTCARRCGSNPMRADGPCFSSSAWPMRSPGPHSRWSPGA